MHAQTGKMRQVVDDLVALISGSNSKENKPSKPLQLTNSVFTAYPASLTFINNIFDPTGGDGGFQRFNAEYDITDYIKLTGVLSFISPVIRAVPGESEIVTGFSMEKFYKKTQRCILTKGFALSLGAWQPEI